MNTQLLRLISTPEQARKDRAERIDKLSVNRSRFQDMPALHYGLEAQAPEARLRAGRDELTLSERLDAWRAICALPKAEK